MTVRSSAGELIERTRLLIGDTAGTSQVFTDQEVQDALDRHRMDQRYLELQAVETIAAGGVVSYKDFYAAEGDWEQDAVLVDASYEPLTPTTSNYLVGKWTFATAPSWPVRIVDKTTVNFLHVGLIAALFPRARIIHTLRDPRDTCVSCLFHNFTQCQLKRRLPSSLSSPAGLSCLEHSHRKTSICNLTGMNRIYRI